MEVFISGKGIKTADKDKEYLPILQVIYISEIGTKILSTAKAHTYSQVDKFMMDCWAWTKNKG